MLTGRHIVLGLSGGIACYKAAELCRALIKEGATVQVVMTEAAAQFITPVTMQALSGRAGLRAAVGRPRAEQHGAHQPDARGRCHRWSRRAAPTSSPSSLHGARRRTAEPDVPGAPDRRCRCCVAPAMNREMWAHPATQRNMAQLHADGAHLLGPGSGAQACGETGDGRMLEPPELLEDIIAFFQPKLLAGKRVLITAGPTFEAIDPVRGITNLLERQDGLRDRARGARGRRRGHAGRRPGAPADAARRAAHRRADARSEMLEAVLPQARRSRRLHRHRRGRRLARRPASRAEDQEGRRARRAELRAHREPRHPRHRGAALRRNGAVLRGLRRREPELLAQRAGQARAQGRAAAGGQHRPGRPSAATTTRCCWSTRRARANCRAPTSSSWRAQLVAEIARAASRRDAA